MDSSSFFGNRQLMPMHSVLHGPDLPNPWIPKGEPDQMAQTQQFWDQAHCGSELNSAG